MAWRCIMHNSCSATPSVAVTAAIMFNSASGSLHHRPPCTQILDGDYSKAAFLCADRSVALHAKFGAYYRTRIPKAGRGLAYAPFTAGDRHALLHVSC